MLWSTLEESADMLKTIKNTLAPQYKNSKVRYFAASAFDILKPRYIKKLERRAAVSRYNKLPEQTKAIVDRRVNYYNKLSSATLLDTLHERHKVVRIKDLKLHSRINNVKTGSVYFFDSLRYLRCYNPNTLAGTAFGDVTFVPAQPSFLKSRPIAEDNANSVLLALNRVRHFLFIDDATAFGDKADMLIGMAFIDQPHRKRFYELYFGHPLCRLGNINRSNTEHPEWLCEPISIAEHLKYKFILCLEGNDVATNLKWVMSSNSLAVMPRPKFETWFMEGTLVGGVHYVEIKDDYSDLEQQLAYYIAHPEQAEAIIASAHRFVEQFKDPEIEHIVSTRVVDKYFEFAKSE